MKYLLFLVLIFIATELLSQPRKPAPAMHLNSLEYLEYEGVNVMLAHD